MSAGRLIKSALIASVYVLICVAASFSFVHLAPWIGCKPISELSKERIAVAEVPADARCYSINHGEIDFHSHGTVAEDTRSFAVNVAAFAIALGLLVWPQLWNGLRAWARGPDVSLSSALRDWARGGRRNLEE
jgi:hypothetical protein